jgi:signal transduction histidine kinase
MDEIELKPVIRAAIESLTPVAEARGIHIECSFDPADILVAGDAERLQQIAWNLISNAVKFTPAGGQVLVQVEKVRAEVELTVSDTGIGILPEFLPHMFERFRQSDCSTTRKYGGLGLGLSLVRHLVELHGGTVHASSDGEGRGATFVVRLPVLVKTQPQRRINAGNNPVRLISPVLECMGVSPLDWLRYLMPGDPYFHPPWLPEQPE